MPHIKINDQAGANDFQHLIYILPMLYILNVLISLLSTSSGLPKYEAKYLLHETLYPHLFFLFDIFIHCIFSINYTFYLNFIFTHKDMLKICLFSIFNIRIKQKYVNLDN